MGGVKGGGGGGKRPRVAFFFFFVCTKKVEICIGLSGKAGYFRGEVGPAGGSGFGFCDRAQLLPFIYFIFFWKREIKKKNGDGFLFLFLK